MQYARDGELPDLCINVDWMSFQTIYSINYAYGYM
jgi:hypothetical protein